MFRLLRYFLKYNLSAHLSNRANLIAGALGMLMNNFLFLIGMWGMLFANKPQNEVLFYYYVSLNALIMIAWGVVNFFFGGWRELADLIVSGQFESKLSTPRHPLILVSSHSLFPSALGDLLMGLFGVGFLMIYEPTGLGIRTLAASVLAVFALVAVYVFAGSMAFFVSRGNVVAQLIVETMISMSSYPMGKIFNSGMGRILLLLTPAAAVSFVPMQWIEFGGWKALGYALIGVAVSCVIALLTYSRGVKRFQALSVVALQS